MSDARSQILDRIRAATGGAAAPPEPTRDYRHHDERTHAERVELFCERVGDYQADVKRIHRDQLRAAIRNALKRHHAKRVAIPASFPQAWLSPSVEFIPDHGLTARELDALDAVVTGCSVAIAETGTIVTTGGQYEGRRLLTLVPDLHICVVSESQIVGLVPEALAQVQLLVSRQRRPLTFISGPSATSDIELERVEGVHGPRKLVVLVVGEENP
jgi:L-lactate dehydrogenase complex protein LldG